MTPYIQITYIGNNNFTNLIQTQYMNVNILKRDNILAVLESNEINNNTI